jgi:hypothetical protein
MTFTFGAGVMVVLGNFCRGKLMSVAAVKKPIEYCEPSEHRWGLSF